MVVQQGYYHLNFAYVQLNLTGVHIQIVVLLVLQMGWCKPTPFFCIESEIAQDLVAAKLRVPI